MLNIVGKRRSHPECSKRPLYGKFGRKPELCADHAKDGKVNVRKQSCCRLPYRMHQAALVRKVGGKVGLCAEHAEDGMVNSMSKICRHPECTKQPSHGTIGGKAGALR